MFFGAAPPVQPACPVEQTPHWTQLRLVGLRDTGGEGPRDAPHWLLPFCRLSWFHAQATHTLSKQEINI